MLAVMLAVIIKKNKIKKSEVCFPEVWSEMPLKTKKIVYAVCKYSR